MCNKNKEKMRKSKIVISLIALLLAIPVTAQRRKAAVKKKAAPPVVELSKEDQKFEDMLESTQQIMFIDSVVVDKQTFLEGYRLSAEAGTLTNFNKFFNSDEQPYSIVYVNQLGNKSWYSVDGSLYTSDLLGNQWSEPLPLEGLGKYQRTNYPFMLADGTTLYFAAISDEGFGGLDIYVSRYDSESGKYLLAENIGLPFNSKANDYMYAIDELNGIGYFATDRRQPEGKVCIYTFIPNQKRIIYSTDDYAINTIRSFAKIERIADTWGDGILRTETLDRLNNAGRKPKVEKKKEPEFKFVVNDDITYNTLSEFRDAENSKRVTKLMQMRKSYEELGTNLDKMRVYYATKADIAERSNMQAEILGCEQEYYQLESDIQQLERIIRYAEIKTVQQ